MFGYVIPDKPNMFIKDFTLYRAFYCGLCKSIGKRCGQLMRLTTNYDMTFFSVFIHALTGTEITVSNEGCILNPVRKKSIAKSSPLMEKIVDANTILAHYKAVDDVTDDNSFGKKAADKLVIKRHFKKACKNQPEAAEIIRVGFEELNRLEAERCETVDLIAHQFATILKEMTRLYAGKDYVDAAGDLMYNLGRWVYFADAFDDADEDAKKGEFNPFLINYEYKDRETFVNDKGKDAAFILNCCCKEITDAFDNVKLKNYEGVVTNIVWYGLREQTDRLLRRKDKCKQRIRI